MPHFCLFLFFFSFFSFTHLCFFFSFSFLWGWACCWGPGSEQSFWHVLKGCSTLMMRSSFLPNSGAKGRDKKRNFHQPPPEFIPWGTLLSLPVSFRSLATPSGQFKITPPPPNTHIHTPFILQKRNTLQGFTPESGQNFKTANLEESLMPLSLATSFYFIILFLHFGRSYSRPHTKRISMEDTEPRPQVHPQPPYLEEAESQTGEVVSQRSHSTGESIRTNTRDGF